MGKIVVSENVSLDGVIQDPTGEEGTGFGGWFEAISDADREAWAKIEFAEALDTAAWLIGRGTYTWFAERWAARPGEWADRLRAVPKYVVSSTLEDVTDWVNSAVLNGDVIEEVTALKLNVDGDIMVYASGGLVQTLLGADLVDEVRLMIYPCVLGAGQRLFGAADGTKSLRLVESRPVGDNLAHLSYQPARGA